RNLDMRPRWTDGRIGGSLQFDLAAELDFQSSAPNEGVACADFESWLLGPEGIGVAERPLEQSAPQSSAALIRGLLVCGGGNPSAEPDEGEWPADGRIAVWGTVGEAEGRACGHCG